MEVRYGDNPLPRASEASVTVPTGDQRPITQAEMIQLFGDAMPMEAIALFWESPDEMTFGELRAKLRSIAHTRKTDERIERVARAICEAAGENPDADWRMGNGVMLTVYDPNPQTWRRFVKQATAAIAAMEAK